MKVVRTELGSDLTCDTSVEEMPPRSYLPSIQPIGLGTPQVESLSSFCSRLFDLVPTTQARLWLDLIDRTVLPENLKVREGEDRYRFSSSMRRASIAASGMGLIAERSALILGQATGLGGLRNTSLLPLKSAVDDIDTIRKVGAWCPVCLWEWKQMGSPLYRPLAWLLEGIEACAVHGIHLRNTCSACGSKSEFLPVDARCGYCPSCMEFLGCSTSNLSPKESSPSKWDIFAAEAVAGILGDLGRFDGANPRFSENLRLLLSGAVSLNSASEKIGMRAATLRSWMDGKHKPRMLAVVRCAFSFGGTIADWLYGEPILPDHAGISVPKELRREYGKLNIHDKNALLAMLEKSMTVDPPVKLAELCRAARVEVRYLRGLLPKSSDAVDNRWAQHMISKATAFQLDVEQSVFDACWKLLQTGEPLMPSRLQQFLPPGIHAKSDYVNLAFYRWFDAHISNPIKHRDVLDFSI